MSDAFVKGFAKITAAAMTIQTAEKVFKAFIGSSQVLSDKFEANMASMQAVTDNFVYALANADFSSFNSGLGEMISKAKEAYAAYDQLGNTMMASSYVQAVEGTKYREAMVMAKDKNLSIEERMAALERAKAAGAEIKTAADVSYQNSMDALRKDIAAKSGIDESLISNEVIDETFRLDAKKTFKEQRDLIAGEYSDYLKELNAIPKYTKMTTGYSITGHPVTAMVARSAENIEADKQRVLSKYKDVIVAYTMLFRESDESLAKMYNTAKAAAAAKNQAAEIDTATNEVMHALGKQIEEIRKKNDEMFAEAKDTAKAYKAMHDATMLFDTKIVDERSRPLELPKAIQPLNPSTLPSLPTEKAFDFDGATEGIASLTSAFRELNGVMGGTSDEMKTFIDNIFKSIDAIVPFISYIIAETQAHRANANAAATDAVAKGLEAHAGIPFAGIPLGISAAAAIISTIMSIPKFAQGGIVTSATLGVFGEAGPEAVMPLDKIKDYIGGGNIRITGEFKQRGKDLVATIDSYNQVQRVK